MIQLMQWIFDLNVSSHWITVNHSEWGHDIYVRSGNEDKEIGEMGQWGDGGLTFHYVGKMCKKSVDISN